MSNSRASLVVGGIVIVLASGAAAFLGSSLAQRTPPLESAPPRQADPATLASIDRQLGYLKEHLDKLEQRLDTTDANARAALELAQRPAGGSAAAAESHAGNAAPETSAGGAAKPEPAQPVAIDDGAAGQMAALRDIYKTNSKKGLVAWMAIYSDTSEKGAARRFAQAIADADGLLRRFGLDFEEHQEKVRTIEANLRKGVITQGERYNQIIDCWTYAREEIGAEMMTAPSGR